MIPYVHTCAQCRAGKTEFMFNRLVLDKTCLFPHLPLAYLFYHSLLFLHAFFIQPSFNSHLHNCNFYALSTRNSVQLRTLVAFKCTGLCWFFNIIMQLSWAVEITTPLNLFTQYFLKIKVARPPDRNKYHQYVIIYYISTTDHHLMQ